MTVLSDSQRFVLCLVLLHLSLLESDLCSSCPTSRQSVQIWIILHYLVLLVVKIQCLTFWKNSCWELPSHFHCVFSLQDDFFEKHINYFYFPWDLNSEVIVYIMHQLRSVTFSPWNFIGIWWSREMMNSHIHFNFALFSWFDTSWNIFAPRSTFVFNWRRVWCSCV